MVISSTQHVRKHLLIPVALTAGLYNSLYYTSFGFLSDLQGTTIPLSRFQIMATTSACILTRNSGRCVIVTVMFIRLGFRQGSWRVQHKSRSRSVFVDGWTCRTWSDEFIW